MRVETVTAAGFGLLQAVRDTLTSSNDSMLCVAFAHERGVRLLGKELEAAHRHTGAAGRRGSSSPPPSIAEGPRVTLSRWLAASESRFEFTTTPVAPTTRNSI